LLRDRRVGERQDDAEAVGVQHPVIEVVEDLRGAGAGTPAERGGEDDPNGN
jgi:hypothetical protein